MTEAQVMPEDRGLVYIFSHPSMPGTYKIGLTRTSIAGRIKTLSNTSVPLDFECILSIKSAHALQLERFIHRKLSSNRVSSAREFFTFGSGQLAVDSVEAIAAKFVPRKYTEKEIFKLTVERDGSTPSQQVKAAGLKSLLQVSEASNTSVQTLDNWHKNKQALFAVVVAGCVSIIEKQGSENERD